MKNCNILENNVKMHFIGIGGIGMSALAKYMINIGVKVSGSDLNRNHQTDELEKLGVKINYFHIRKNAKNKDVFIYSSAITDENPEYVFAKEHNKPLLKRSELLGLILKQFTDSVAISGCHGKTTTTAMLTHILSLSGKGVTAFIGGEDKKYSNFIYGKDFCVTEACEFRKNILDLSPKVVLVTNIDNDHMDCYNSIEEVKDTYKKFIEKSVSIINADDANSKELLNQSTVTFGIVNEAMIKAVDIKDNSFTVFEYGKILGKIKLKVSGRYNIYNALSAIAVARHFGVSFAKISEGLSNFDGVKRRNELLGEIKGCKIIADYAHHPREISEILGEYKNKKYSVVFQPHTFSRTKLLMNEFVDNLKSKNTIIYSCYSAREKYDYEGSSYTLYKNLKINSRKNIYYAESLDELYKKIDFFVRKSKYLLVLGAGDIYDIIKKYIELKQKRI